MKKINFFTLPRLLRRSLVTVGSLGIIFLFLITGGCGKKIYIPPDNEVKSNIILRNEIYAPGFYVEVDGGDAGFLQQELEIRVKPGNHTLKIFNKETSISLLKEKQETITHTFNLNVKVSDGEDKEIVLSWEDKGYSKKTERRNQQTEQEKEEIKKQRKQQKPGGGMGGLGGGVIKPQKHK